MNDGLAERLLAHNQWATRVLLERCRSLSPEQLTHRFEIGMGSVHDTLRHVIGAMLRWADRIGERGLRPPIEAQEKTWTPDELRVVLDEAGADLRAVIGTVVDEGRLDERMSVVIRGHPEPFVFTRGTAIVHVATHGVHHRAQVLNMLRRLGVEDLPDVDAVEAELAGAEAAG